MCSLSLCFLFLSTILLIIHFDGLTPTAEPTYVSHVCYGNQTTKMSYMDNLNQLLNFLSSSFDNENRVIRNGYYTGTYGRNPDIVYGSLQCTGNVTSEVCKNCVQRAAQEIIQSNRCPNSEKAIIWYDECLLRYSNQLFFSIMEDHPRIYFRSADNITNPDKFDEILAGLLDDLVRKAVSGSSSDNTWFSTGETNFTNSQKVYGMVQCTPDISSSNCKGCLQRAIAFLSFCCNGKKGGRVMRPSCYFRYEIYHFYQSKVTAALTPFPLVLPPSTTSPNRTTRNSKEKDSSKIILIIVIPSVIITILSTITIWYLCLRRRKEKKKTDDGDEIQSVESFQFTFNIIRTATNNFSDANKLGQGGFGSVYKGTLSDGQEIAVKRLSRYSDQGEQEFKNEVALLVKLQHRNLVRLLGFCLLGEERLLVYEFMPNASLDQLIFDPTKNTYLDWDKRYKIVKGIARGLLYLHEDSQLKIIHRDLKASNILLGYEMNPKISDFGLARMFLVDQTQARTNRIAGTYGYMAPEYAMHGHFSVKSDVFSFGVLVLEILSGKRNNSFYWSEDAHDLLSYASKHWKEGTSLELLDPTLRDRCSRTEVMRCIHIGLLCVQEDVAHRPTMASIIHKLNNYSITLPSPSSPPTFFVDINQTQAVWTVNEVSITEPYPR